MKMSGKIGIADDCSWHFSSRFNDFSEKYGELVEQFIRNEDKILTLDFVYYEFSNAIRKRISRKELSTDKGREIFEDFKELMSGFEIYSYSEVVNDVFDFIIKNNISVFDASFVVLAIKNNCRLLTTDLRLFYNSALKDLFVDITKWRIGKFLLM